MDPDVRRNVVTVYVKKNVTMSTEFAIMGVKLVTTILAVTQNVQMVNMDETVYKPVVKIVMCPRRVTKRLVPAMVVVLKDGNYLFAIKNVMTEHLEQTAVMYVVTVTK